MTSLKRSRARHRTGWLLAAAGLAVLLLATNLRLVTGRAVPIWDADHAFASWYSLVADFARHGRLLIWNPWTNGGSPDFADPQFGALSPLTVGYGWLAGGSLAAFTSYWLMVWLAGGLGMVVLARHLRAPAWGGFIVGAAFVFSGFMTGHAEHTPFLLVFSALPWILWRLDVALERKRVRPAIEAGVLLGVAALAGYPGMVIAAAGYAFLWAAGRALIVDPEWRVVAPGADASSARAGATRSTVLALISLLLVAAVVASPTYLGFLVEGRGHADRAGALARGIAVTSNAFHPGALATFSSPLLSILQWRSDLWAYTDISSSSIYVGSLATWLAVFALVAQPRQRWRWWLVVIGVAGLALAMGQALPFRGWLYDVLPPTRYFRHAAIFRSYFIISVLVLALYGTRDLRGMLARAARARRRNKPLGADDARLRQGLLIAALAVAVVAVLAYWSVAGPRIGTMSILVVLAPWIAMLIAAAASSRLSGVPYAVPMMLLLVVTLDAFTTMRLAGFTVATEHPGALAAWGWVERHRSTRLDLDSLDRIAYLPIANGHTNKHLPAKMAVMSAYTPNANRFHAAWLRDTTLLPAALGHERIWFAPANTTPMVVPSSDEFSAFLDRTEALGRMPAVVHQREAMLRLGANDATPSALSNDAIAAERLPFALLRYEASNLSLRVTVPEHGYVVVTDRWARGWDAFVDGGQAPVLGANFIFRAIPVEAGTHDIVMLYRPSMFRWLLVLSWGTILITLAVSVTVMARRAHSHVDIRPR